MEGMTVRDVTAASEATLLRQSTCGLMRCTLEYFAALLVALWGAAVIFQAGMWVREVFSRHGGTGVGCWLPGAALTFSAPFLGVALLSGAPLAVSIFPGIIA